MSRLRWDDPRQRGYETGVDRGVLYPAGAAGVAWNGLVSVEESSVDTEVTNRYVDGHKYHQRGKPGGFMATITAFTYPAEFEQHAGFSGILTQQRRQPFGFSYRTMNGERDYKIHLVYNALASPSSKDHESMTNDYEAGVYSWGISTLPSLVDGGKRGSHLYVDSRYAYPDVMAEFEDLIYGNESLAPTLPTMDDVLEFFESRTLLRITDHGDGTWTADGPAGAIVMLDSESFEITWPSAVYIDEITYRISSL